VTRIDHPLTLQLRFFHAAIDAMSAANAAPCTANKRLYRDGLFDGVGLTWACGDGWLCFFHRPDAGHSYNMINNGSCLLAVIDSAPRIAYR
jgi:hypothetical protein